MGGDRRRLRRCWSRKLRLRHGRERERRRLGDNLSKIAVAAQAKIPDGTIIRVETDADGNAAYEAHMTDASGAPVTLYVDKEFKVVGVDRS